MVLLNYTNIWITRLTTLDKRMFLHCKFFSTIYFVFTGFSLRFFRNNQYFWFYEPNIFVKDVHFEPDFLIDLCFDFKHEDSCYKNFNLRFVWIDMLFRHFKHLRIDGHLIFEQHAFFFTISGWMQNSKDNDFLCG